jgi:hypothetical protein
MSETIKKKLISDYCHWSVSLQRSAELEEPGSLMRTNYEAMSRAAKRRVAELLQARD